MEWCGAGHGLYAGWGSGSSKDAFYRSRREWEGPSRSQLREEVRVRLDFQATRTGGVGTGGRDPRAEPCEF